jgi:hypothetical protein
MPKLAFLPFLTRYFPNSPDPSFSEVVPGGGPNYTNDNVLSHGFGVPPQVHLVGRYKPVASAGTVVPFRETVALATHPKANLPSDVSFPLSPILYVIIRLIT